MLSKEERQELRDELRLLIIILDFHVQYQKNIIMRRQDLEEYINDILDRINAINQKLEE
ncbi:MAG TPA: hypothetical protein VI603_06955 [Saprospiraceae bacterium]|nr:hypothetical protein [Saprospiraceae bacterium]